MIEKTGNILQADVKLNEDPEKDKITVGSPMNIIDRFAAALLAGKKVLMGEDAGIHDFVGMRGHVKIRVFDPLTGETKQEFEQANLVVTTGKVQLAKQLNAESVNAMTHVAIGTSSQSPAAGDTGLVGTEVARVAATKTRTTNAVQFVASYAPGTGTSATINEAGIFDGSSGTVMLARVITSSTINKTASDQLDITWTITIG